MASTYSPNLRIELIGNGEQSNTWGTTTNTNLGTLIEQAISGLVSVDVTAGNVTLTTLNGASDQSRQMIIVATGTPGVTRTITAPAVNKVYIVYNNSNAALSFIASGGTGVSLSVGAKKLVYCDGTNFVEAINSVAITSGSIDGVAIGATTASTGKFTNLEYTGTLTGGTGVVNIGSNQIYKDASGNIGIGGASLTGISLLLQKSLTGSTDAAQLYNSPTILSGVTSTASLFVTSPSTQAAAFALASLTHYNTSFNTKGAGSSITNQYGFSAESSLTTATNNYAFTGNLASGTGRYNLYMAGTADNYIAGSLGIGATTIAGINVLVQKSLTGYADAVQIYNNPTILSDVTSTTSLFTTSPSTQAAAFTLASLTHYNTSFNTKGAGSAITNQYGFSAASGLTGATNNYAFTGNLAAATGRYNLYIAGTADNYMAGSLGIGSTSLTGYSIRVAKAATGNVDSVGVLITSQINSDVTSSFVGYQTQLTTQAASFTTSNVYHFLANALGLGASSAVSNQFGFVSESSLTTATNNYAFRGNIPAGTGRYNLHMAGTANNYLAGSLGMGAVPSAGVRFTNQLQITGSATSIGQYATGIIQSDVSSAFYHRVEAQTAAASFSTTIELFSARSATVGAGSTISTLYGFIASSGLAVTGVTNAYGFRGDIASGTGRYNLYMAGTADNYMAGSLGIGVTPSGGQSVAIAKTITGATTAYGVYNVGAVQSDVTTRVDNYVSVLATQAAVFTLTDYNHFRASSAAFGAGSVVTNQYGFNAASTLSLATNNYGFYGNIAAATGRYNLYMAGTADNYMAGSLGIGAISTASTLVLVGKNSTGSINQFGVYQGSQIQSDVIGASYFTTSANTAAVAFTLANLRNYYATQGVFGAGSVVTNQYGVAVESSITGATNNYAFFGNIAAATGRYNLYMAGTANNYLGGPLITAGLKATSAAAPTIASATTIAPTTQIAFVSGTTAIATITAPSPISLGGGQITLIPTGIFTTTTAGNIALASTAVVGKALIMTYDATTTKWYPSY